jgi:hypothetical protein
VDQVLKNSAQSGAPKPTSPYSRAVAHESAIKAVEYFRVESLAEYLWLETRNPKQSNDSASISFARDPLREWNHIHKYLPFKIYRWYHTGWLGVGIHKLRGKNKSEIYHENIPVEQRLRKLAAGQFFQRMMRLRAKPSLRNLLPRDPRI